MSQLPFAPRRFYSRFNLLVVLWQAGERQADVLSRQVSKSSTESQDLAREREVLLDKLRAAEQVMTLSWSDDASICCTSSEQSCVMTLRHTPPDALWVNRESCEICELESKVLGIRVDSMPHQSSCSVHSATVVDFGGNAPIA